MNIDTTETSNTTETAIGFIPCYAQVFLGDCLELYKDIEPKSIDLILTDLPYGTTACKWDTIIPFDKLWEMVNYLLKPNGAFITTASQPFTSALVMSNPKEFKHEWIWRKNRVTGIYNVKTDPLKAHENIIVFAKNRNYVFNRQMEQRSENSHTHKSKKYTGTGIYEGSNNSYKEVKKGDLSNPKSVQDIDCLHYTDKAQHPTQKPIKLMDYLLKTYSNEGMTIFDPCMGSGTTGVACKNTNRSFIGIEKDEQYFKIAEQRINARALFS
jgi:site-specific DNA-methyltransferase (adenine-specific)